MSRHLEAQLLDEHLRLTLTELCRFCDVHAEYVLDLVTEGVLSPQTADFTRLETWTFTGPAVVRVQRARRLQHDLGVNLQGVALALDLLDELEETRRRLRRLVGD